MTGIVVKTLVEVLSILALASKQIKQGRFSKRHAMLLMYLFYGSTRLREVRKEAAGRERD
jgi:hypothetical protein